MSPLKLFTGNRLELLAEALARVLETPLASPLDPEIIVVQSKGMERWVSMQLALHFGVCTNCRFPFPNAFVQETFKSVLPEIPDLSIFDPKFSTWKIMHQLQGHLDTPGFETLKHYLDGSPWSLKQMQLSRRIAEIFDQYILYRPDMIARWEAGEEDHWQALLWRTLVKECQQQHRAALGKIFLQKIRDAAPETFRFPHRVSLFGISYLPPFHLQIFEGLSRLTEVNQFFLNPCKEYWGDIASDRDMRRLTSSRKTPERAPEALFLDKGNPLLASMGTLGKNFFELLSSFEYEESFLFHDPKDCHLLACLQWDILNLKDRAADSKEKTRILKEDTSLQVHSCHSPMREVEVLYDHLLELFEKNPDLLPKDILVMTPDIEAYAPFIQAVFDAPDDEGKRIPYSIADRSMRNESQVVDTFLAMLGLGGERLTAPQILGILEVPSVRAKFGLTDVDLDLIMGWVRAVRIRWGVDEQDRLKWLPSASRENTWRGGIERLLLGYAMPGNEERLFAGILPYENIEGSEVTVLGNFVEFVEQLFHFAASLNLPRTLTRWSEDLMSALLRFFLPDEDAKRELQALREVLADLDNIQEFSGYDEAVDARVIKWHLEKHLEREGFGLGFITGSVTFCSMLPMRSIPFTAICLIGMNSDSYPRQAKVPDFDLLAKHPRPGDRSARNDDRYLFLEAVISAREKLYISYTGQDSRDNTTIPPSVLVSELLDYVHRGFTLVGGDDPEAFVIKHRLQPFSPAYFEGDHKLFTYSHERLKEAACTLKEKAPAPVFISEALSPPEVELKQINIMQLCRFFGNPARFLLKKRFGIDLEEESALLEETESFELSGLEKYSLEQTLIEARRAGRELPDLFPSLRAAGILPHGVPGESAFTTSSRKVEAFARQMEPYLFGDELEPLAIDLPLAGFTLTGRIHAIYRERMVRYRYAAIKAKDHLSLWIQHLVLNLVQKPGYPRKSMLIGLKSKKWYAVEYVPIENSREVLEGLLQMYWNGLIRPLPFFPETSLQYAQEVLQKGTLPEKALLKAEPKWAGNDRNRGERQDPCFQLCFRSGNPLDADFQHLAEEVFQPLLASRGVISE